MCWKLPTCVSGGDAVPGAQTGSASAASFGWSADLGGQRWWCHRVGRSGRRWDRQFHSLSDRVSAVTHHASLFLSLSVSSRRVPAAAVWPRLLRCVRHDAPQHLPEQGSAGKLPGCTAAVEHQDQVSTLALIKCSKRYKRVEMSGKTLLNVVSIHNDSFVFFFSVSCCLRSPAGQQASLFCSRSVIIR